MLLDAASLYFRAFYGVPTSITTPDGRPINAVRGFLDMSARLIATHAPDRFVACWDDDWRPAFRTEALPSYKAHRLAPAFGIEVIIGEEVSTAEGHLLALFIEHPLPPGRPAETRCFPPCRGGSGERLR